MYTLLFQIFTGDHSHPNLFRNTLGHFSFRRIYSSRSKRGHKNCQGTNWPSAEFSTDSTVDLSFAPRELSRCSRTESARYTVPGRASVVWSSHRLFQEWKRPILSSFAWFRRWPYRLVCRHLSWCYRTRESPSDRNVRPQCICLESQVKMNNN